MQTSWHFFAVHMATPLGFGWQWQKQGGAARLTSAPFDFYFDCICDARDKGYTGPLPAGPKVVVEPLPIGPIETKRVFASLPSKGRSGRAGTVTAVDLKARR